MAELIAYLVGAVDSGKVLYQDKLITFKLCDTGDVRKHSLVDNGTIRHGSLQDCSARSTNEVILLKARSMTCANISQL